MLAQVNEAEKKLREAKLVVRVSRGSRVGD
jgi:hypothetical protein